MISATMKNATGISPMPTKTSRRRRTRSEQDVPGALVMRPQEQQHQADHQDGIEQ